MMEARGISVKRGGAVLLDQVSLTLHPGQMTVVIGPNGAGKSTLLKCLAGEWQADDGTVLLHGEPLETLPASAQAQKRAVMWQSSDQAPGLSVLDLVTLGRTPFGDARSRTGEDSILDAIHQAHLSGMEHRRANTLSGGERQRADFARSLCQIAGVRAPILMLDEPTASLDLKHQYHLLMTAQAKVREGAAVLAVLHYLSLARRFADHVIALKDGRVFAAGAPADVINDAAISDLFDLPHTMRVAV